jgi:hypothetical protein
MTLHHMEGPAPSVERRGVVNARPRQSTGGTPWGRQQAANRFWSHVDKSAGPDGCWLWTRYRDRAGYGRWASPQWPGDVYAHRIAYRMEVGPIPADYEVDHLCFVPACVNPAHLEAVTLAENRRLRRPRPLTTECAHGHAMDEANTYVNPNNGSRHCRACMGAANRAAHQKYKAQRNAARNARRRKTA